MARIIARRDTASGYVYFISGDGFPVPVDARGLIKRHGGDFNGDTKEWRAPIVDGPGLVAAMKVAGHDVVPVNAGERTERPRPVLLECKSCSAPHGVMSTRNGVYACLACGADPIELVPPHVCDEGCKDRAGRVKP